MEDFIKEIESILQLHSTHTHTYNSDDALNDILNAVERLNEKKIPDNILIRTEKVFVCRNRFRTIALSDTMQGALLEKEKNHDIKDISEGTLTYEIQVG